MIQNLAHALLPDSCIGPMQLKFPLLVTSDPMFLCSRIIVFDHDCFGSRIHEFHDI